MNKDELLKWMEELRKPRPLEPDRTIVSVEQWEKMNELSDEFGITLWQAYLKMYGIE